MLISGGAAMLLACPRRLALGLLPLALARCVLGSTYAPATYAPVAFYAPAAYAPAAARGARVPTPRWGFARCGMRAS